MSAAELERRYRRWLRWYPKSFRREHEMEILGVLLDRARAGQRQPDPMECLDLVRSALWVRLRPNVRRSDYSAHNTIKLLVLGALVELAAAITIVATIGDVKSSVVAQDPGISTGEWHEIVAGQLVPTAIAAVVSVCLWLWMAWSIGRGHQWVRVVFMVFFGVNTWGLVSGIVGGSAEFARSDLVIGGALWIVELATVVYILTSKSTSTCSGTSNISATN